MVAQKNTPKFAYWAAYAFGWILLALNALYLADRTYSEWTLGSASREVRAFAWALVILVVVSQFAVGRYSYLATRWHQEGQKWWWPTTAMITAGIAVVGAIVPAFTFDLPRWVGVYSIATAQTFLPPLVIFLEWHGPHGSAERSSNS